MKILVVYQHYYPEPFRISDICETLVKRDHEVTVLTGLPNYPEGKIYNGYRYGKRRLEFVNGVKVIRTPLIPRGKNHILLFLNYLSFAMIGSLKAFMLKDNYSVVYAPQTSPVMMALPAIIYKMRRKRKVLLYCMDLWPDSLVAGGVKEGSLIYILFLPISKWIYKQADKILVSSKAFIDYFKEELNLNISNISYLPQYAEEVFDSGIKKEISNQHHFVFAGNVGEAQSIETIIKSAYELRDRNNIIFHIVGSGSKLEENKQLAKEMGLTNILFHGRRPLSDMPNFYSMASAMLVTLKSNKTFSFTLPGKVQSYMAAGKAIIAAADGETSKVIEQANCGFFCSAEDYQALASNILKYCSCDNIEQMSENAKQYYHDHFRKDLFIEKLEDELKKLEV